MIFSALSRLISLANFFVLQLERKKNSGYFHTVHSSNPKIPSKLFVYPLEGQPNDEKLYRPIFDMIEFQLAGEHVIMLERGPKEAIEKI